MRRRLMDCSGRLKRLPSKRTRTPETPQGNNLLHVKLFCGWSIVLLLDLLVGFRLEYLYPAVMFLRSVIDSYKYQGFVFSLLFIILVIYLDTLCWTLLVGPWLFLIASSFVWLELIRSWDTMFGYTSIVLWMLFLYVEVSQRMSYISPIINFLRPFAAHCIGYPVITMSFLLKHQIQHVIRQRQQRRVSEENAQCFDILTKALPITDDEDTISNSSDVKVASIDDSDLKKKPKPSNGKPIGNKVTAKTKTSGAVGVSKRDPSPSNNKSNDVKVNGSPLPRTSIDYTPCDHTPLTNGDIRPVNKSLVNKKQQAMVKAVPRMDLQQQAEAREKAMKSSESLMLELKEERQRYSELESENMRLDKLLRRLQADLAATTLQEEEADQRITSLTQQEKNNRTELQRLKNENETLLAKLTKLASKRTQDEEMIRAYETQLKSELSLRQRVESDLREQRSQANSMSQWSKEEMKEVKEKLVKREKEISTVKEELHHTVKKCQTVSDQLNEKKKEVIQLEAQCEQLKLSLADETRVKIKLFTHLSDARKKHEGLVEELQKKTAENESLRQKMQQLVTLQNTWTPSLSPHH